MVNEITLISGGFDPIHSGHVKLITHAGPASVVIALNSDEWLIRKKGNYFLPWEERASILMGMAKVHRVIEFDDSDDSACAAIQSLKDQYPDSVISFHNGGDRTEGNVLEALRFKGDPHVKLYYGIGGKKSNASSDILQRWVDVNKQTTERNWGEYNVLADYNTSKVKTLIVKPGESLSMQKHQFRSEHWFVAKGTATVRVGIGCSQYKVTEHNMITIKRGYWHQLSNDTDGELVIVEIQYGEKCEESDIARKTDK